MSDGRKYKDTSKSAKFVAGILILTAEACFVLGMWHMHTTAGLIALGLCMFVNAWAVIQPD